MTLVDQPHLSAFTSLLLGAMSLQLDLTLKDHPPRLAWPGKGEIFDSRSMMEENHISAAGSLLVQFALTPIVYKEYRTATGIEGKNILAKAYVYVREPDTARNGA